MNYKPSPIRGSRYEIGEIKIIIVDCISDEGIPTKKIYAGKYQLEPVGFYQVPWYGGNKILCVNSNNEFIKADLTTANVTNYQFNSDTGLLSYCFDVPSEDVIYCSFGEWVSLNKPDA